MVDNVDSNEPVTLPITSAQARLVREVWNAHRESVLRETAARERLQLVLSSVLAGHVDGPHNVLQMSLDGDSPSLTVQRIPDASGKPEQPMDRQDT